MNQFVEYTIALILNLWRQKKQTFKGVFRGKEMCVTYKGG